MFEHDSCYIVVDLVPEDPSVIITTNLGVIAALALSVMSQCVLSPQYGSRGGYIVAGPGNSLIVSASGQMRPIDRSAHVPILDQCLMPGS